MCRERSMCRSRAGCDRVSSWGGADGYERGVEQVVWGEAELGECKQMFVRTQLPIRAPYPEGGGVTDSESQHLRRGHETQARKGVESWLAYQLK